MENFNDALKIVQELRKSEETENDFSNYLSEKANAIGAVLMMLSVVGDKFRGSTEYAEEGASKIDGLSIPRTFLSERYKVPRHLSGVQMHLLGLSNAYRGVNITFNDLIKLDTAAIKLTMTASAYIEAMPKSKREVSRIEKVKEAKRQQGQKTADEILTAYKDLEAEYAPQNEKKPFSYDGESFSFNGFALELKVQQGLKQETKQITKHLKDLIKSGSL